MLVVFATSGNHPGAHESKSRFGETPKIKNLDSFKGVITMNTLTFRTLLFGIALAVAAALLPPTASAASPNLFASVAGNGTLVNGNGVSSVTHTIGTGQYEVTFTSVVSSCAYVSPTHNAFSQASQSSTAGAHLSASAVYVERKNQGGR